MKILAATKTLGIRWKRGMFPRCLLSHKGRTCNQTLLVHQDMTKNPPFMKIIKER